jgi:hypothetical protein
MEYLTKFGFKEIIGVRKDFFPKIHQHSSSFQDSVESITNKNTREENRSSELQQ